MRKYRAASFAQKAFGGGAQLLPESQVEEVQESVVENQRGRALLIHVITPVLQHVYGHAYVWVFAQMAGQQWSKGLGVEAGLIKLNLLHVAQGERHLSGPTSLQYDRARQPGIVSKPRR